MDVCDPAMLVVKQEPPDPDSPSQTRISLINSGLDEKSQALTKTFSALCDLLHEYRAELELTRENQEKEDRYPKLVHEINTLKTKISSRDTEIERLQRLSDEHVIKFNTKDREKDAEIERLEEKLKFCDNKAKAAMQRLSNAHVVNVGKLVRELSVKDAMVKEANSKIEKMENKFRALGASYLVETENEESSTPVPERLRLVTSPALEMTSPGLVTSGGSGNLEAAGTDAAETSKSKNEPLDVVSPVPTTSGVQEPPSPPSPEVSSPPELTGVLCIKEEVDSEPDGSDPLSALLAEPQQVQDSEAVEAHAGSVLAMKDTACSDADCSEPAPKRTKWEPVKAAEGAEKLVPDSVVRTPGKRTSKLDIKLAKLMSLSPSSALAASRPQPVTSSDSGITSQILPMPSPAVDPKSNTIKTESWRASPKYEVNEQTIALSPSNETLSSGNGTMLPRNGAVSPNNGIMLPSNGTLSPNNGTPSSHNGIMSPSNGALSPNNGIMSPSNGTMLCSNGTLSPDDNEPSHPSPNSMVEPAHASTCIQISNIISLKSETLNGKANDVTCDSSPSNETSHLLLSSGSLSPILRKESMSPKSETCNGTPSNEISSPSICNDISNFFSVKSEISNEALSVASDPSPSNGTNSSPSLQCEEILCTSPKSETCNRTLSDATRDPSPSNANLHLSPRNAKSCSPTLLSNVTFDPSPGDPTSGPLPCSPPGVAPLSIDQAAAVVPCKLYRGLKTTRTADRRSSTSPLPSGPSGLPVVKTSELSSSLSPSNITFKPARSRKTAVRFSSKLAPSPPLNDNVNAVNSDPSGNLGYRVVKSNFVSALSSNSATSDLQIPSDGVSPGSGTSTLLPSNVDVSSLLSGVVSSSSREIVTAVTSVPSRKRRRRLLKPNDSISALFPSKSTLPTRSGLSPSNVPGMLPSNITSGLGFPNQSVQAVLPANSLCMLQKDGAWSLKKANLAISGGKKFEYYKLKLPATPKLASTVASNSPPLKPRNKARKRDPLDTLKSGSVSLSDNRLRPLMPKPAPSSSRPSSEISVVPMNTSIQVLPVRNVQCVVDQWTLNPTLTKPVNSPKSLPFSDLMKGAIHALSPTVRAAAEYLPTISGSKPRPLPLPVDAPPLAQSTMDYLKTTAIPVNSYYKTSLNRTVQPEVGCTNRLISRQAEKDDAEGGGGSATNPSPDPVPEPSQSAEKVHTATKNRRKKTKQAAIKRDLRQTAKNSEGVENRGLTRKAPKTRSSCRKKSETKKS